MLNLDYKTLFKDILNRNQFTQLVIRVFEIRLHSAVWGVNYASLYFEQMHFSPLFTLNILIQANKSLQQEGLFEENLGRTIENRILEIFNPNNYDHYWENLTREIPNYLQEKRDFIQFFHLAILRTFDHQELLGRLKLMKLCFLASFQELRKKAITIRQQEIQDNLNQPIPDVSIDLVIPHYIMNFQRLWLGQFDRTIRYYVHETLLLTQLAEEQKEGSMKRLQLTSKGVQKCEALKESNELFSRLLALAQELKVYFDMMNGKELASFIKEKVAPNWNETAWGGFY